MYARVATFQGDPVKVDAAISRVRGEVETDSPPAGLEGAQMLMLVNRESGKALGVTLFEDEEALRRGDEALNAMTPVTGGARTSVEFYEVPVHTLGLGSRVTGKRCRIELARVLRVVGRIRC